MTALHRSLRTETPVIRRAGVGDVPRIARVFAAAFANDPVFRWLTLGSPARRARLERFFHSSLKSQALADGETWTALNGLAAATWIPPYSSFRSAGLLDDLRRVSALFQLTGMRRLTRGAAVAAAMADAHPKEPCFHLALIGVAPRLQRAGLASLLLKHTLDRVDAAHAPAYLENSNPKNLPFYERAGFVVTREILVRRDAPPLFAMWRRAR
jgi:ribosomal protein S18 acetylase RimI-like enzyme